MVAGTITSLWRYPVKSMMGEELNASIVTEHGLFGDRAYAIMDRATGKVASAKHPRKWKKLFECHAAYVEPPKPSDATIPPVWITLPDGTVVRSEEKDIDEILSNLLMRDVELRMPAPTMVSLEEYWPDIEGLTHRETVTDEAMPPETFFDLSPIHVLTTSTIDRLRDLYSKGRFEVRRFSRLRGQTPACLRRVSADTEFQAEKSERAIVVDLLGQAIPRIIAGTTGRVSHQFVVLASAEQLVDRDTEHLAFQVP